MNKVNLLSLVIACIVVGAISFYGGMKYGQGKPISNNRQGMANLQGRPAGGNLPQGIRNRGSNGNNFISGEVIKNDDSSITVKLPDGGSKIIFMNASSTIVKSTAGAKADLETGKIVSVNGTANSDGSMTAQMIQLRDRPTGLPLGERSQPAAGNLVNLKKQ